MGVEVVIVGPRIRVKENKHGGSRPVVREDDGRLISKLGKIKLVAVRILNERELEIIHNLTPRERTEILIKSRNS